MGKSDMCTWVESSFTLSLADIFKRWKVLGMFFLIYNSYFKKYFKDPKKSETESYLKYKARSKIQHNFFHMWFQFYDNYWQSMGFKHL